MQKLRISSTLALYGAPKDNMSEYLMNSLDFFKKVGLDAADFHLDCINFKEENWMKHIEKAAEYSEEIKMKFELCHLPFSTAISTNPELLPEFNEKVHKSIDVAAFLGIEYAVLHPNAITLPESEYNRKEQYENVVKHIEPFVEHAEKVNVKLTIENMRVVYSDVPTHRYCQTPEELCEVADTFGIGVCWDFGHANISRVIQSEGLAYVGSRLKAIHVNDNRGIDDEHIPTFMGTVDWKDAAKGLADIGYNGLFNFEIGGGRLPESVREAHARYLVDCAKEIMSY